jgi:hypothetical protein
MGQMWRVWSGAGRGGAKQRLFPVFHHGQAWRASTDTAACWRTTPWPRKHSGQRQVQWLKPVILGGRNLENHSSRPAQAKGL